MFSFCILQQIPAKYVVMRNFEKSSLPHKTSDFGDLYTHDFILTSTTTFVMITSAKKEYIFTLNFIKKTFIFPFYICLRNWIALFLNATQATSYALYHISFFLNLSFPMSLWFFEKRWSKVEFSDVPMTFFLMEIDGCSGGLKWFSKGHGPLLRFSSITNFFFYQDATSKNN